MTVQKNFNGGEKKKRKKTYSYVCCPVISNRTNQFIFLCIYVYVTYID